MGCVRLIPEETPILRGQGRPGSTRKPFLGVPARPDSPLRPIFGEKERPVSSHTRPESCWTFSEIWRPHHNSSWTPRILSPSV